MCCIEETITTQPRGALYLPEEARLSLSLTALRTIRCFRRTKTTSSIQYGYRNVENCCSSVSPEQQEWNKTNKQRKKETKKREN